MDSQEILVRHNYHRLSLFSFVISKADAAIKELANTTAIDNVEVCSFIKINMTMNSHSN